MTRSEVAKAIGRSIATVRRMEGNELNLDVDWKGVHWFDEEEVEAVAEQLRVHGRRSPEHSENLPDFILASQLRSIRAEKETMMEELEKLRKVDLLAVKFMELADDAIGMAEDIGCREIYWLRVKYPPVSGKMSRQ